MIELAGRVALVTGAGQKIGAEIARQLARCGAAVAVNDRVAERAAAVVSEIEAAGGRAFAAVGDVTREAEVARFVRETAAALGPVDILVNNAGLPPNPRPVPFLDTKPPDWEPWLAINVQGVLLCTHAVLAGMCERGWGRIVTILSEAGRVGERNQSVYSAAKAAAGGFSRSLAHEVARRGVTVNCVSLGSVWSSDRESEAAVKLARRYPMGRLGLPQDVAPAVAFFASDEAAWITGQTLPVNGGWATT
jgi:3-oxoacyl-[acyl-carrier protein] reductase